MKYIKIRRITEQNVSVTYHFWTEERFQWRVIVLV